MIESSQVNPAPWFLWPTNIAKSVYNTVIKRSPAVPATQSIIRKPCPLTLVESVPPSHPHILCLSLVGELNRHSCTTLLETAITHHNRGRRALILDLAQTTVVELSGLFVLLNIARHYSGQTMLDPEGGWQALRESLHATTPTLGERVKLLAPSPQATAALDRTPFCHFLERHPDLDSAIATFN